MLLASVATLPRLGAERTSVHVLCVQRKGTVELLKIFVILHGTLLQVFMVLSGCCPTTCQAEHLVRIARLL